MARLHFKSIGAEKQSCCVENVKFHDDFKDMFNISKICVEFFRNENNEWNEKCIQL